MSEVVSTPFVVNDFYLFLTTDCCHGVSLKWRDHKKKKKKKMVIFGNSQYMLYLKQFLNIHIYLPLHSGRIWHEVNFKWSLTGLNSKFSFS